MILPPAFDKLPMIIFLQGLSAQALLVRLCREMVDSVRFGLRGSSGRVGFEGN